jgi:circadian clock protein KaiC
MLVSSSGLAIVPPRALEIQQRVSTERVSSGVERLDTMLDGGYLRGSCTLISGGPGTSKTSLAGAFAQAACARGERTLFVSFEEAGEAIVRNLASVNIRLGQFVRSGLLRMCAVPASGTPAEAHTFRIGAMIDAHEARCVVIDPVSALVHAGASEFAGDAVLGLLDLAKGKGVTVLLTSLLNSADPTEEKIAIGIWTNADTWMRLSDVAAAGERNRALTIVKSRGTAHSNQVRELILNRHGVSLVDVYTAGGAVLMGTLRRQKEEQELAEHTSAMRAEKARHADIASGIAETQSGIASLRADVDRKRAELRVLTESSKAGAALGAANLEVLRRLRGADVAPLRTGRTDRPRPLAGRAK